MPFAATVPQSLPASRVVSATESTDVFDATVTSRPSASVSSNLHTFPNYPSVPDAKIPTALAKEVTQLSGEIAFFRWNIEIAFDGGINNPTAFLHTLYLLKELKTNQFALREPIWLSVTEDEEAIIVFSADLSIYGYGKELDIALDDFEYNLVDTFRFLRRKQRSLATNIESDFRAMCNFIREI